MPPSCPPPRLSVLPPHCLRSLPHAAASGPPTPPRLSPPASKGSLCFCSFAAATPASGSGQGRGAAGGRDGTGGKGWGEQVLAWASSMDSRTVPAAGSGSPHRPLPTLGTGLGFIPRKWGPIPPPAPPAPLELALLQGHGGDARDGERLGMVWADPPLLCPAQSEGAPSLRVPPAQGGSGPWLPPAPEAAPWGRGGQCPPLPVAGTPSSRRLHGARLISREGTRRWTQERGGVSGRERGGRE